MQRGLLSVPKLNLKLGLETLAETEGSGFEAKIYFLFIEFLTDFMTPK